MTNVKKRIWSVAMGRMLDAVVQGRMTVQVPILIKQRIWVQLALPTIPLVSYLFR